MSHHKSEYTKKVRCLDGCNNGRVAFWPSSTRALWCIDGICPLCLGSGQSLVGEHEDLAVALKRIEKLRGL